MRSGLLRHRVIVQEPQETRDQSGGTVSTFVEFAAVSAEISPLAGREALLAQQVNALISHRVVIRFLAGLTTKMQLLFGERVLRIHAVRNIDERRREMELLCGEIA